jgi:hypothetical protein
MAEPALPSRPPWTRESTIRIDRDGRFWHAGAPVTHPGLARAFAQWIATDPETGRYILKNPIDWCFITVDDAPLCVRAIEPDAAGGLVLQLSDDSREPLDPASLRIDEDDVPYCHVHAGTLPARFSSQAAFALLERVDDAGALEVAGRSYPLRRVARGQGAAR